MLGSGIVITTVPGNNRTSAAALIQGVDVTNALNQIKFSELTTDIEDSVLLAF